MTLRGTEQRDDQTNPHWGARCSCICHICDHDSASGIDRTALDAAEKRWICEECGTVFSIVPADRGTEIDD